MLPQIKKNIFQIKSNRNTSNNFSFKKFLISVVFSGTAMISTSQASMTNNDLKNIIHTQKSSISTFTLNHSERIGEASYHSSHSSHSSHRSHYSSRY